MITDESHLPVPQFLYLQNRDNDNVHFQGVRGKQVDTVPTLWKGWYRVSSVMSLLSGIMGHDRLGDGIL